MENLTQHQLKDWGSFEFEGTEVVRRWYKLKWTETCNSVVATIAEKLRSVVEESVDVVAKGLSLR